MCGPQARKGLAVLAKQVFSMLVLSGCAVQTRGVWDSNVFGWPAWCCLWSEAFFLPRSSSEGGAQIGRVLRHA